MASREARQRAIKRAVRTVAKSPWLRRSPRPRPVLYDWKQDYDVIGDFGLWGQFTVQFLNSASFVSEHAPKPKPATTIVENARPKKPLTDEQVNRILRDAGWTKAAEAVSTQKLSKDAVAPPPEFTPGEHVLGSRPGVDPTTGAAYPPPEDPWPRVRGHQRIQPSAPRGPGEPV